MVDHAEEITSEEQITNTPEADATNAAAANSAETSNAGNDPLAAYRQVVRAKQTVQARVVKWQRDGLEMEILPTDELATIKAFMPNESIDRDPNRNIADYFGKTIGVKITSVKMPSRANVADIRVSHRAVIEEELRTSGRELVTTMNVGDVVDGIIKSFAKDNILVDLGPGVDAVIRLRDLSWEHVEHPYTLVKRGDSVRAKVLSLDRNRRRVQLGVRQLTEDPALAKYAEYTPQQSVQVKVVTIGTHGAEVELPNGLIAFLPMSEVDWKRIHAVTDVLQIGDTLEVQVLTVSSDDRRITVSRKQLIEDPRRLVEQTFRVGSDHNGTIKEVNRGGVVMTLEFGTEGFIPRRELSYERIERLEDVFKAGKPLENARVIEFDRKSGKITLSLIAAEKEAQRDTLRNYRQNSHASSYSLADSLATLKAQLEAQEQGKGS